MKARSCCWFFICAAASVHLSGCNLISHPEQAPATLHTDRRSSATVLIDSKLEVECAEILKKHISQPENAHVYIKIFNKYVLILGQYLNRDEIQTIQNAISSIQGIKNVYNEISLTPPSSSWQRAKDQWITTKITAGMMLSPKTSPWKIHVLTENAVVYFVGIVTPEEEEFALSIAKSTSGVRKIVKLFDYKSSSPSSA